MNVRDFDQQDFGGDRPPSADILAGEYVLGVLDGDALREAEAKVQSDAGFARLVWDWQRRLAPWWDSTPAVAPPDHAWPGIRSRLGWAAAESERTTFERPAANDGLWQRTGVWRAATAFAMAAAIAAVFFGPDLRSRIDPPTTTPPVAVEPPVEDPNATKPVTTLARDDGRTGWLASVDRAKGTLLMVPVPSKADEQGRVPELWLIPPGESPKSLGIVSIDRAHTVSVPEPLREALKQGAVLAITLEPQGGAPQGIATGPIIAKGDLVTL
ncbi:MAG: hypothetical protein E6Q50_15975 [Lysobacter sp.]|nr:MAG: hypothetical protein E6Q50_15975 [Lysobacter sp.]